jgi:hypothetical protein
MKPARPVVLLVALGVAALVVAFVLIPAARGRPLVAALGLGTAGLLAIAGAFGTALAPRVRAFLGWAVLVGCPVGLFVWVAFVGVPAGAGALVMGAALALTAVAGLVIAVREVQA